ncbi:MAG: SAM-dependent methyltransferase [Acidimicrobiia bacterium]|nr:SAM-dependent methyltransferase [Acidimicrobiia bacterium]
MPGPLAERLAERIRREGPITFDRFVEAALYDPDGGFFARGGGAGRSGADFVTSPEVGPLFGVLVARALDRWWEALGRPDPYLVVEAGAGRGRLAREVLRADPACATALRYVLVERSPDLRAAQRALLTVERFEDALGPLTGGDEEAGAVPGMGPIVTALDDLPGLAVDGGVVLANELLDDLPFEVVERRGGGWVEVRVGLEPGGGFGEVLVPAPESLTAEADALVAGLEVPDGARLPVQRGVAEWVARCGHLLHRGYLVVLDYADTVPSLLARGQDGWLRTYRAQQRGGGPLDDPGSQDVTADVVLEALRRAARESGFSVAEEVSQARWLAGLGLDELVEEGRAVWRERAHLGDLEAIAARSRASEADALTDPGGLGAHVALVLTKGLARRS